MIPRWLRPVVLGTLLSGCAAGQVAPPPAGASSAMPDPHEAMSEPPGGPATAVAAEPDPGPAPTTGAPSAAGARIDFAAQVRPILEGGCRPCHFAGGQMYASLPFDQPATIRRLGTQLFTRIRKEEERTVIRAFLEQPAEGDAAPGAP